LETPEKLMIIVKNYTLGKVRGRTLGQDGNVLKNTPNSKQTLLLILRVSSLFITASDISLSYLDFY
jgi:hypothetical protein